jgi:hypothetical protein
MATNRLWERILLSSITVLELPFKTIVSHSQFEAIIKKIKVEKVTSLIFHSSCMYDFIVGSPTTVTFDMLSQLCNLTKLDINTIVSNRLHLDSTTLNIWSTALTALKSLSLKKCVLPEEEFNKMLINLSSLTSLEVRCVISKEVLDTEDDYKNSDSEDDSSVEDEYPSDLLQALPEMTNLRTFTTDQPMDDLISECTQLQKLVFWSPLDLQYVSSLTNLLELKMYEDATNFQHMTTLTQLQKLSLDSRQLVVTGIPYFPSLTYLKAHLNTSDKFLNQLPNLQTLKLHNNVTKRIIDQWPPHDNIQKIYSLAGRTIDESERYRIKYPKIQFLSVFNSNKK